MAKWKLTRQTYGSDEFVFNEGEEITIGRGTNNTVTLSSLVISRKHCSINLQKDKVIIEDLKSSNGTYVGTNKIPPNTPITVKDSQIIGIGWLDGAGLAKISDEEKFVFRIVREGAEKSIVDRIKFQNDCDEIEEKLASTFSDLHPNLNNTLIRSPFKRKSTDKDNPNLVNLLSDSDTDLSNKRDEELPCKKIKLEPIKEELENNDSKNIKPENYDNEYDVNIKQELLGYDDEPITIEDSDSDIESERRWFIRLSQSSPGKPLKTLSNDVVDAPLLESSYSQTIDDHVANLPDINYNDEELFEDIIKIPSKVLLTEALFPDNLDQVDGYSTSKNSSAFISKQLEQRDQSKFDKESSSPKVKIQNEILKKAQLIEPKTLSPKKKSHLKDYISKERSSHSSSKYTRSNKEKGSKTKISDSQKEKRKIKLKEIAEKEKDKDKSNTSSNNTSKVTVKTKNTSSRGAFLGETMAIQTVRKKESPQKSSKNEHHDKGKSSRHDKGKSSRKSSKKVKEEVDCSKTDESSKPEKNDSNSGKSKTKKQSKPKNEVETRPVSVKNLKPLTDSEDSHSNKPISKVGPMLIQKPKKAVRFSEAPPQVREFEIEPGNQMKKTSLVKATLLDIPQVPAFSLERITLMRILRWNPHWLSEQINNNEPPPILGHNIPPMSLLHYFHNHTQYVQVVGDLLLMEIWESITQTFMKKQHDISQLEMRVESIPPIPPPEKSFDLFNITVNVSMLKADLKSMPRIGELMIVSFGPENVRNNRFFYVHNVRCLPSPPNNKYMFFSVSLHTVCTERLKLLRQGEVIYGKTMCYIKNVLSLFDSMEYLARSPLREAILRPDPRHFPKDTQLDVTQIKSAWTRTLNESQLHAVASTVNAALNDKPTIQMIQGPPGTGKSSVICSIIMTYYYDTSGKRLQNRGKILICATSNAAVDELVIRLLHIRQSLPKSERFRMVRVGRPDAMHPKARDLSSQSLAQRDAQSRKQDVGQPGIPEEIGRQEARLNMWHSQAMEAKDPARRAFCYDRIEQIKTRINQLKVGNSNEISPEHISSIEKRIIECADIIVSTLSSAANQKMRGLKRRVALCIVDEAGQAIEPDTLIPLTLDINKLTLIGDPQQLPGFIKSQRAKQHGLGESLFSRLSSLMEQWNAGSPVMLLKTQYRMHPEIADYPNRAFYNGVICNAARLRVDHPLPPYVVVHISSGDKGQGVSGANEMEAWGVSRLVTALNNFLKPLNMSIAVITPYEAQRETIKKNLRLLEESNSVPVEVNTVDSFQGQERDVIVVSLARSKGVGFLNDAGRMNVMLTRAKHSLLICVNPNALVKNAQWKTLMDDAQQRNLLRYLPSRVCQGTSSSQQTTDDILKYITYQNSPN